MAYRRRDKPPFSAWLTAERTKRGWKAPEVARRLRELGYQAEESTYRTWEAGRRPSAETIAALERLFESAAPGEDAGGADVAAAIDRQTAAITALVEELRLWREGDRDRISGLENLVGSLAARSLDEPAREARPARRAPLESTGSGR